MSLKETISSDLQAAMKKGDALRRETLRTIRAALLEKEIEKRGGGPGMTPEDEIGVLTAAAKKRRESIEQFRAGNRPELADQEERELAIIQEYLPKQLTPEEVENAVRQVVTDVGASGPRDFGKVMPAAMKVLKGKADGKIVQETVKRILGA
ncbi:MAG TPA: GatB/YqeY domain-containing protein [Bacteroidota bacterium]|nr:GatB/YqeY domain-containing protein [Bacteroidota bacterium]